MALAKGDRAIVLDSGESMEREETRSAILNNNDVHVERTYHEE